MIVELDTLRWRFSRFLLILFWAHVPLLGAVAWLMGDSPAYALAAALLAGVYHLTWWRNGIAPATRYLSAVALMAEPAILLLLLRGHAWQMDMHMYFFAMLALTVAWCDRWTILVAATTVALHHLLLLYLLPYAVFPADGDLPRVLLHAAIVAFQTVALVWFSNMLVSSFHRIDRMRQEILVKNEALEERTREAEAASKAKSMFLANMSHEIRTPMNAILGFCHLVARTDLNDKQRDYVTKINGAAVSLLRLINDILDFSKNDAGKLTLEVRPFDLRAAVASQIQLVAADAAAKGVETVSEIDPALPKVLVGDELRFNQVLLNLLSNAIKFSSQGRVTVGVSVAGAEKDGVRLEMFVRDNGVGIPADQQAGLFNSFTQADSSTTRKFGGTGLGLAICRQIVEQMDGAIRVDSAPGQGSTFTCHFVLAKDEVEARAEVKPSARVQKLRILAADDNPAARQIMQEIFEQWGMAIDLVASGQEAIAACRDAAERGQGYDLVLLDWKMPGMDGVETVRLLHETQRLPRVPAILIVTAYGTDDLVTQAGSTGISAFLSKPIDPRALLDAINTLFPVIDEHTRQGERDSRPDVVEPALPVVADNLRGLRVLLVEDNDINREIAMELLTDAGLTVDCAENGRVACERVEANGKDYAAILMDVQMPEMDGIEATRIIRASWNSDKLPIIAMTAHAFEEERQRCFSVGMNDHVAKPVDPLLLTAALNRWLKPRAGVREVVATVAAVSSDMLPRQLPPFNIEAALKRVNGKEALLRKLILNFADTYAEVGSELRTQISAGMLVEARRLAHSLKGVAGSLELDGVQAAAAHVERLLAEGRANEALAELDDLAAMIGPAVNAARSLGASPDAQLAEPGAVARDAAAVEQTRTRLQDLIGRRSLAARRAFDDLASAMGMTASERSAHPLHQALQNLDYDAALALMATAFNVDEEVS